MRIVTLAGTATALAISLAPTAMADDAPSLNAPDGATTSAQSAAEAAKDGGLMKAFTSGMAKQQGMTAKAVTKDNVKRTHGAVPVYTLSPKFVQSGKGPVGVFAYSATTFDHSGQKVTIDSIKQQDGGWVAANVADGADEAEMATAAQGAPLLLEPQIGAWYAVRSGSLTALNSVAEQAIGGKTISVKNYQKQVNAKYGSRMPGSEYDKSGAAGGYKAEPAKGVPAADKPAVKANSSNTLTSVAVAGAGMGVLGAAAFGVKRRRSN